MTYNVTGLTTATKYYFSVIAVNEVGEGPKSETAAIETGKNDNTESLISLDGH